MKSSTTWWAACALVLATVSGCGSDSNSGGSTPPVNGSVAAAISAAAAVPSNDSAINASAPFTVVQGAGLPAVSVASPPKLNFTVFSDGAVKTGLTLADMSFAIAKLVPGTNGNPDEWQNYVSRKATATAAGSPGAAMKPPATAMQATTDPKRSPDELAAAGLGPQLVYNEAGYYTYTFSADITNPAWSATINKAAYSTNGVVFDPNATHRVAIQLSYTNAAGEVIRVNPNFSFRFVANAAGGYDSVLLTDPATQNYLMTDVSSCNSCHEKLALHGGGRVDVQYCVMCHNPGTTDPDSGNVLTMSTMTHKIHAGRGLAGAPGGEHYTIWGYNNVKYDYSEVGFPQALQNCAKCHTAQNPSTPQGDNWKSVPSQEACLTCHASNAGSSWDDSHLLIAQRFVGPGAKAKDLPNSECARCHAEGTDFGSDVVHFNQIEVNSALYKMNIESTTFNDTPDQKGRSVTVKYFLSNPTADNAAYNLVTPDCTGTAAAPVCSNTTKFGNLRFYLAYQNMAGQSAAVTEFTAYNNGGNSANAFAYKGSNDGSNHYTVNIPLPDDVPPNIVVSGTAQVASAGQVKEPTLRLTSAANPRPPATPASLTNVVVQHTATELALTGSLQPRRVIVSNDKCNVCHGALGSTSGSNTLANAFHGGSRDTVQVCVTCHDVNKPSGGTVMTSGLSLQRVLPVQAHDPRHPWQLQAPVPVHQRQQGDRLLRQGLGRRAVQADHRGHRRPRLQGRHRRRLQLPGGRGGHAGGRGHAAAVLGRQLCGRGLLARQRRQLQRLPRQQLVHERPRPTGRGGAGPQPAGRARHAGAHQRRLATLRHLAAGGQLHGLPRLAARRSATSPPSATPPSATWRRTPGRRRPVRTATQAGCSWAWTASTASSSGRRQARSAGDGSRGCAAVLRPRGQRRVRLCPWGL